MRSFKDYLIEELLDEMSIYDTKYPIGTQFSPSGGHIDKLNSKGMPVKANSLLTKVAETDGAIQISLGSSSAVEAWIELDNKVYHVTGSRNQVSVPFIKRTDGGGINWNAKTIETAQCLGVFVDGEDLLARVFQHEYDHMEGIDFQSLAGKVSLDIAKRKRAKAMRKMKKMQEKT